MPHNVKESFEIKLNNALFEETMTSVFKSSGAENMKKIYGGKAKLKKMVSGRYTKQPWYELSF